MVVISNKYGKSSDRRGTNMLAILGKIVSLRTPTRLLATSGGILGKKQIQVRQIVDVDVAPDSFSLPDFEGLPTLQGLTGDARYLVTAGVSWARSITVNGGWTNNCDLQGAAAAGNNNLVNITVKVPILRERSDFSNVLDVIVDLLVKLAEFVGFFDIAENSRAGSMDVV